jgi:hypothetical protein
MVKLSKNQLEVLKLMSEGWKLSFFGCFSGFSTWVNMGRIRQENYPTTYNKEKHVSVATIKALENKGLIIKTSDSSERFEHITYYALTEKGKEVLKGV